MKFSHKVFFSTLLIIAVTFSLSNAVLIGFFFRSAMEREEQITLDENQMLRFSFVTAVSSAVTNGENYGLLDPLSDSTLRRVGWSLENSNGYCIRISDSECRPLYVSTAFQNGRDMAERCGRESGTGPVLPKMEATIFSRPAVSMWRAAHSIWRICGM